MSLALTPIRSRVRLLAALPLLWTLAGCTSGESNASSSTSVTTAEQTSRAHTMIRMHTNHGVITLKLDTENAPKTTANFLQYVDDGHFNGTIFHRVIPGFMIQGGGFEPGMSEKNTREPVENEAKNGLKNKVGSIAMARRKSASGAPIGPWPCRTSCAVSRACCPAGPATVRRPVPEGRPALWAGRGA